MNDKDKVTDSGAKVNRNTSKWFWFWAALAVAIFGLRFMTADADRETVRDDVMKVFAAMSPAPAADDVDERRKMRAEEMQREREKRQLELEKEKLRADVDARVSRYRRDVNAIVEKYSKMLPLSEAEECFGRAEKGVDFIVSGDGLCGFKACGKLAYKMAYDKINETHRAEEAVNSIVSERVVAPVSDAVSVYEKWTADFRRDLEVEEKAFSLDLAVRSQKFTETVTCLRTVDVSGVSAAVDKLVGDVMNHANEAALAAAGTVVELAMIRSSYAAIRAVAVRIAAVALAGVTKKLVTTVSVSTISVLADGPLPIGDVVAVVFSTFGLAWIAYDIYKVCKTMPGEMRAGMMKAVNETRDALRQTAVENLNSDREECLRSADARVKELQDMINR